MREKKPEVGYIEIMDDAPEEWLGEIEVAFLSYEKLPLLQKPFFNEVLAPRCSNISCCWTLTQGVSMTDGALWIQLIFFHKPSKTLITTDFFCESPPCTTHDCPHAHRQYCALCCLHGLLHIYTRLSFDDMQGTTPALGLRKGQEPSSLAWTR